MTCDQFVLAANWWSKGEKLPPTQVFTSGTSDSISGLEKKIKMFNDGTDPTAGIDKDYQNGYTATLNFPKIDLVVNLI